MTFLPKNGQFYERRKMFIEAPFHNMKSYVPLDWSAEQASSQQLQRIRIKQSHEQQSLRKIYNQRVDKILQRRYVGYLNQGLSKSNQDVLSRELEMFNHSKINLPENQRAKRETREMGLQYQTLDNMDKEIYSKSKVYNAPQISQSIQKRNDFKQPKQHAPYDEHRNPNPQNTERDTYNNPSSLKRYEQNHSFRPQQNTSFVKDRYRSLQIQRSPYPKQNLSKLVEQLYTGSKVEQYPFRNICPDKLQTHLRQKTKADRKRAYEVSLNLFKH